MKRHSLFFLLFPSLICFAVAVGATDYPAKPVQVIAAKTPGSVTDFVARALSKQLSLFWDEQVDVENHPGADGVGLVAKAAPDGYTLLVHSSGYVVNQLRSGELPFADLAPLAKQPLALVVSPTSVLKSVSEVIAAAEAKPGEIKYGTPGTGSAAYIAGEKLKREAGIDVVHVPLKGGPETVAATSDGRVDYSFLPLALALKGEKEGKLLTLGVTSTERAEAMPDVPTIGEAGFSGGQSVVWWGVWAPAGTPDSVKKTLERDIARALATPEIVEQFNKRQLEPMSMPSAEFEQFVLSETESVKRIFEVAGIETK